MGSISGSDFREVRVSRLTVQSVGNLGLGSRVVIGACRCGYQVQSWVWAEFSAFIFGVLQFEFMEVRAKGSVQGSDFRGVIGKSSNF